MCSVVGKKCEYVCELCEYEYVYNEGFSFSCCLFFFSVYLTNLLANLALSSLYLVPPAFARPAFAHLQHSPVLSVHSFSALARPRRSLVDARPSSHSLVDTRPSSASGSLGTRLFTTSTRPAFALLPRRQAIPSAHSFSGLARSQRLLVQCFLAPGLRLPSAFLVLGTQSFPTLVCPAFARPWHSPILVVHSFLVHPVLARPAFTRSAARQSSVCTRSRQSSILGVCSFSALAR
jgi:hypothetical protein